METGQENAPGNAGFPGAFRWAPRLAGQTASTSLPFSVQNALLMFPSSVLSMSLRNFGIAPPTFLPRRIVPNKCRLTVDHTQEPGTFVCRIINQKAGVDSFVYGTEVASISVRDRRRFNRFVDSLLLMD